MKTGLKYLVLVVALAGFLPGFERAGADTATNPAAAPAAAQATVDGFRSARFGMDQAQVEQTISTDFHLSGKQLQMGTDPQTLTPTITVEVPGLFAGLGKAMVSYVMGYQSHRLIQVIVAWDARVDTANNGEALIHGSSLLQSYFLHENFPVAQVVVNRLMSDGDLIVFRGQDTNGHLVVLAMQGILAKPDHNHKSVFTPKALTIGYVADPGKPDIFSVPKGAF